MKKDNLNIPEENASTAARLRALRAEKGDTQKEMSELLGVSQQTYSNYEKGISSLDSASIIKLCKEFDVSADYLLGIETSKKSKQDVPVMPMSKEDFDTYIANLFKGVDNK